MTLEELVEELRGHRKPNSGSGIYCRECVKQPFAEMHPHWMNPTVGCEQWETLRKQHYRKGKELKQLWEDALVWLALETGEQW